MAIASHVIFTTYGFWLPNDPRGSWSTFVGSWELFQFGAATKVDVRHSVAGVDHDRDLRRRAKLALKYPPVKFTGIQAAAVACAIGRAVQNSGYVVHACSIMPTHVHMVVARHERDAEDIVGHLKYVATRELSERRLHPFQGGSPKKGTPSMWGKRAWKVFLDSPEDVMRAIRYVRNNPMKEGRKIQRWKFEQPYVEEESPRTRGG